MKKILNVFAIVLFVNINSNNTIAKPSIDSLRVLVRNMSEDTLKVIELSDLSYEYKTHQIDTSLALGKDALGLAQELEYEYGEAYSLFNLGIVYRYRSEYNLSVEYTKRAYEKFNKIGNNLYKGKTLNSLGNVYRRQGDFERSLLNFYQSLEIFQELKDSSLLSSVINNIALLYYEMKQYDKALEFLLQNLEIKKRLKCDNKIPIGLINIGIIYGEKKDYKKALDYYKEALNLIQFSVDNYDKLLLLHNMGVVFEKTEKFDEANNYYQKALQLEKEIGEKSLRIYTVYGIGNVLIKNGRFSEGEKYLIESFLLAKELGELRKQSVIALSLRWFYENQKQYKNSLIYSKLHTELKDSILDLEKIKQITSLEQKYEAEKREHQIASLEKEQALQKLEITNKELENRKKSLQRNALIIAVIFVLLIALYYRLDNKKRKKINVLLKKQNTKIFNQRKEIVQQNEKLLESNKTKDKLFQIIAHDLRSPLVSIDSLTQLIPYWVEEQDYKSLRKLSKTLELSVNNVLSLIDNLLNWALNQQGEFPYKPERLRLKENIIETIEVYSSIAEIKKIDLKFKILKDAMVFADKNMLFTVMRNLLNNAVKFTPEKGKIEVGIDCNLQFATVWVKDTGIGIPKEKKEMVFQLANGNGKGTKGETGNGLGLFFCKEFVAMNNGEISIESDTGKGTTITFTIPLFDSEES